MSGYRHILLGLDLSGESQQVVARAVALRDAFGSTLSVIHVIEPLSFASVSYTHLTLPTSDLV